MFPSLTGAFGNEGHSLVLKPITEPLFTSEFSEFHHNFSKKITTGHQALRVLHQSSGEWNFWQKIYFF